MTLENEVSAHYTEGGLLERIVQALEDMSINSSNVMPDDLKPVDEFHIGGIAATNALIEQLDLSPGMKVLDIGCGIGGTPRCVASRTSAHVTGLDLTPEFVETARALSKMVGMGELTDFQTGSALTMPFENDSFDAALLIHVGMNIPDKETLLAEAARVLKPGALFAIYDIMKVGPEPISFPVPWASIEQNSFLASLDAYREAAAKAGFSEISSRNRTEIALEFFQEQKRRAEVDGSPVLGLHILMGPDFPTKVANMVSNISDRRLAPTELILRLD